MPRIQPVNRETTDDQTTDLLTSVEKKMGRVPNIIATMANSPAVARAYLGISQALATGSLSPQLREKLALVVGEQNSCDYCVAAHTAIGKSTGLSNEETVSARRGQSDDPKDDAALRFAHTIVKDRGWVSDADFEQVRAAGFTDGEIGEIVACVAQNIFTNYFNHVAGTEVDFPEPPQLD